MGKKYKIVFMPFPFDDLTSTKVRPALCLTDEISIHSHVVVAFITSKINSVLNNSDVIINSSSINFIKSGLKVSSTINLHKLITVSSKLFIHEIGELPEEYFTEINNKLKTIFQIK